MRLAQSAAREKISVRWLDAAYGEEQLRQMAELAEHGWEGSFRELSVIVET